MLHHRSKSQTAPSPRPDALRGPRAPLGGVSCSVDEPFLSRGNFSRFRDRTGGHVEALQWYLKKWGYLSAVDGIYGPNTEAAVAAFQQEAGITVDGIVGPETQGALCDAVVNWLDTGEPFTGGGSGGGTYPGGGDSGGGSGGTYPGGNTGGGSGGDGGGGDGGGGVVPGTSAATDKWVYVAGAGIGVGAALLYARS